MEQLAETLEEVLEGVGRDFASLLQELAGKEGLKERNAAIAKLDARVRPGYVSVFRTRGNRRFFAKTVRGGRRVLRASGARTPTGTSDASPIMRDTYDASSLDDALWARGAFKRACEADPRVEGLSDEEIDACLASAQSAWLGVARGERGEARLRVRAVFRAAERKSFVAEGSLPMRYLTVGGSQKGIVGGPGDKRFKLPPDLGLFLRHANIRYDARLNPRRRRRVRGVARKRWIMRVSHGFTTDAGSRIAETLNAAQNVVLPRRHWELIHARDLQFPEPGVASALSPLSVAFLSVLIQQGLPATVAIACGHAGPALSLHACLHVIRLVPQPRFPKLFDLDVVILDPHGTVILAPASLALMRSTYVDALDRANMRLPPFGKEALEMLRQDELGDVVIRSVRVRAQPVPESLRVQYAYEGSCGPSSVALALSAARVVAKTPFLTAPQLARAIFEQVRDEDVVLAAHLVHNLV